MRFLVRQGRATGGMWAASCPQAINCVLRGVSELRCRLLPPSAFAVTHYLSVRPSDTHRYHIKAAETVD